MKPALRGIPDLKQRVETSIESLIENGVLDTVNWIETLRRAGMSYAQIIEHPIFPIAASLIKPALTLVGTKISEAKIPIVPVGRTEVLTLIEGASDAQVEIVRHVSKSTKDPRILTERGFCPAPGHRLPGGSTWLSELVLRGVELHQATSPKFSL